MPEMKGITYKEVEERLMIGMQKKTDFTEAGKRWQEFFGSKDFEIVRNLSDEVRDCEEIDANEGIGCMFDFTDSMHFTLLLGEFVKAGVDLPEGIASKRFPKGLTAPVSYTHLTLPTICSV